MAASSSRTKANFEVRSIATNRELSFLCPHFGDIDVEEANRIGLELLPSGLFTFGFRQSADAMPLQATVQRRARQVRDGRLKRIETII